MTDRFNIIEGSPKKDCLGNFVGWDDCGVGYGTLWTHGIGPCLAITIYDEVRKMGALAHISGAKRGIPKMFSPEKIVETLYQRLEEPSGLTATLSGESRIEDKISEIVKRELKNLNIPIVGEDLGDTTIGRSVYLHCNSGEVEVYRYQELED